MTTRHGVNATLRILAVAGLPGITLVAPNGIQGIALLLKRSPAKRTNHERILAELKRQNLVHISQKADELHYSLTTAGAKRLQRLSIEEIQLPRVKKWDKKWRIVSFDVPVKYSGERAAFVNYLQNWGFMMLQKSVWVHAFPCFEQIEHLAGHYNLMRYCILTEASRLDEPSTRRLLRHFDSLIHT